MRAAVFVSSHSGGRGRIAHVVKQPDTGKIWDQLFEEFNPFGCQLGAERSSHPVTLPFGCARLATMASGRIAAITTGIVSVAFLAALVAGVPSS